MEIINHLGSASIAYILGSAAIALTVLAGLAHYGEPTVARRACAWIVSLAALGVHLGMWKVALAIHGLGFLVIGMFTLPFVFLYLLHLKFAFGRY
jgi:hypothetical protein